MAKGYNIENAKVKQQQRSENLEKRDAGGGIFTVLDETTKSKMAVCIELNDLYSAPSEWNFFKQLDDNQTYEMVESVEKEGLLNPILVWKVPRESISLLQKQADSYGFLGFSRA